VPAGSKNPQMFFSKTTQDIGLFWRENRARKLERKYGEKIVIFSPKEPYIS